MQLRSVLKRSALLHRPCAQAKSRSRPICTSQYPKSTSQAASPAEPPGQEKSLAVPSDSAAKHAKQAKQAWSSFPVGVASWQHSAQETLGAGQATGSHTGDSSSDWDLLGEAAAEIARYKAQQQADSNRENSSIGGSDGGGWSSKKYVAILRQLLCFLRDFPSWLQYRYYNWRQDTLSDLLVVTGVSLLLLCSAAVFKHTWWYASNGHGPCTAAQGAMATLKPYNTASVTTAPAVACTACSTAAELGVAAAAGLGGTPAAGFCNSMLASSSNVVDGSTSYTASLWDDLYTVLILSFGESFPPAHVTDPAEGAFSLLVALVGLAGFALALALVEQIVLETNLANVSRGSRVHESNHYLVLGWGAAQRDLEVIIKVVGQLCSSARSEGGTTIVVLTQREKLAMEEMFRRAIPPAARHGSRIVLRQGSPLLPSDLSNVAAGSARATIIISDESKSRDAADAQSLRCAILLEELDNYRGLRKGMALGHIVVETQTSNAVPLLYYSCSRRVMALPTARLNARRVAAMVKRPFVSWVTQRIWDFDSKCCICMHPAQDHVGMRFADVPFRYPDATVLGVTMKGRVCLNPPLDYRVERADQLVLCRAADVSQSAYKHMPLLSIPELEQLGQQRAQEQQAAGHPAACLLQPFVELTHNAVSIADSRREAASSNSSSGDSISSSRQEQQWQQWPGSQPIDSATILATGNPIGNNSSCDSSSSSTTTTTTTTTNNSSSSSGSSSSTITHYGRCGVVTSSDGREASSWSWSWTDGSSGSADFFVHEAPVQEPPTQPAPQGSPTHHMPQEYLCIDSSPQAVLVAGWPGAGFMSQLLWELDKGTYALPPGSELVFANPHPAVETLGLIMGTKHCANVKVSHVLLDPLRRDQLACLPLHRFRAAIVLADEGWCGSEVADERYADSKTVSDAIDQPSVLTQDALIVMVQLNIRKLLDESGLPPINIICEKVANQGLTRFEDRQRLPLGISVNFNSLSAKLLTQVAVNPMALTVLTSLGGPVALGIVDASALCARGEVLSFWSVLRRSQAARLVLLGYYILPCRMDQPIESTVNPVGLEVRSRKQVWNTPEGRLKFIVIGDKSASS